MTPDHRTMKIRSRETFPPPARDSRRPPMRDQTRENSMFTRKIFAAVFAGSVAFAAIGGGVAYAKNPMVGGAPMYANKNIIENAVNSKDHTTLVAAVKAAGLVE